MFTVAPELVCMNLKEIFVCENYLTKNGNFSIIKGNRKAAKGSIGSTYSKLKKCYKWGGN